MARARGRIHRAIGAAGVERGRADRASGLRPPRPARGVGPTHPAAPVAGRGLRPGLPSQRRRDLGGQPGGGRDGSRVRRGRAARAGRGRLRHGLRGSRPAGRGARSARPDHHDGSAAHPDRRADRAQRRPEPVPSGPATGRGPARRARPLHPDPRRHPGRAASRAFRRGSHPPVRRRAVCDHHGRRHRSRAHPHPRHAAQCGGDRPGHLLAAGHRPDQLGRRRARPGRCMPPACAPTCRACCRC